jgi:hypothetical protein
MEGHWRKKKRKKKMSMGSLKLFGLYTRLAEIYQTKDHIRNVIFV